eukprot:TRINITY_DN34544_c0_g1_i10.p1 TRINITY_DN34544_c0_g1~~TRINITY_DN34544_c0_g1_i10.p1  ORF type:complete len:664 (-),score=104.90 TRINITY_DN34544_c0_g1_i10:334-2325(-)
MRNLLSYTRRLHSIPTPTVIASTSEFQGLRQSPCMNIAAHNRSINEFIKSGSLGSAIWLFKEMPDRDVISWNLIINGHARHGFPKQALYLFQEMVSEGIRESASTFSSVLSICADAGFCREGIQVHSRAVFLGHDMNLFVGSAVINLYMQVGFPPLALRMFDELSERSIVTWNLILRGFCELGQSDELLEYFSKMKHDGVDANDITISYLVRGCSNGGFLDQGKQLHCRVIKLGWIPSNIFIANALMDLYSASGCLVDAKRCLESIPVQDVISWNSIVSVHADNGLLEEALEFFYQMQSCGMKYTVRPFLGFLNLSSGTQNLLFGEQIHGLVKKLGFDCGSTHVQSALIHMYGKCNKIQKSFLLFDEIPRRNVECFNAFITSLLHCGLPDDVIDMFGLMVNEALRPDHVTFSVMLKALSSSASASLTGCRLLHCCVIKLGYESNFVVSCSLIDAYSRSGRIEYSLQMFELISCPNVICYTAIIAGYARNGLGRRGLEMFESLIEKGLKPDAVTFLSVLTGCDHSGLVEEGRSVFESMKIVHGVNPDRRHHSCMVNLLGRAGLLEEAKQMLEVAPFKGDSVMWSSLLGSCRVHGNEKVGKIAAETLMNLEPEDPTSHLQVSMFYKEIGDSENLEEVRELIAVKKMRRAIGYSLVEVNNRYYLEP